MSQAATRAIANAGLTNWSIELDATDYRAALYDVLQTPILVGERAVRYRFPALRAEQISLTRRNITEAWGSLEELLGSRDEQELRRRLLVHAHGIGPKQASLFLRNIERAVRLAILDTHVLRYMHTVELIREVPTTIPMNVYLVLESVLQAYADAVGYSIGLLDRAIWAVMLTARREGLLCRSSV